MIATQERRQLNIKDLVVNEPINQPALRFDPKIDLSPAVWRGIKVWVNRIKDPDLLYSVDYESLISHAIISPEDQRPLISDQSWKKMKEDLKREKDILKFKTALTMKLIAPDRYQKEELLTDEDWDDMNFEFGRLQSGNFITHAIGWKAKICLIDPERAKNFKIKDKTWEKAKVHVGTLNNPLQRDELAEFLSDVKIVDPEKINELDLTTDDWEAIWQTKDDPKFVNDMTQLIRNAGALTILAAPEIVVTNTGVVIKIPRQKTEEDPKSVPIPQRRRF